MNLKVFSFQLTPPGGPMRRNRFLLRNLIVPVVGNFSGPKAIRAIGAYVSSHGAKVSAFYVSTVEARLKRDGSFPAFCGAARRRHAPNRHLSDWGYCSDEDRLQLTTSVATIFPAP